MKKIYLYGNWKMNILPDEAAEYCGLLLEKAVGELYGTEMLEMAVFPPFVTIPAVLSLLEGNSAIHTGAQDAFFEDSGAYTGSVSMEMIRALGCTRVLVGHSERRHIFGDSNEVVARKLRKAVEKNLRAVLCFGETIAEKESGKTMSVIEKQLATALEGLSGEDFRKVILAYEPVWAIGTGRIAGAADAQEVCSYAREFCRRSSGGSCNPPVLYGGSVKENNALMILSQPDVDGVLVGGASLKVHSFLGIYDAYRKLM